MTYEYFLAPILSTTFKIYYDFTVKNLRVTRDKYTELNLTTKLIHLGQDYAKAVEWYEKAAAQGHAAAQSNLGVMYVNGRGVRQNKTTAKEWFGKACDNGDQDGCAAYRELNEAGY